MTNIKEWKKITAIYDEAIKLKDSEQKEFVKNNADGNKHLSRQVMKMLDSENIQDFMGKFPGKIKPENIDLATPKQLGHFKILKKIATGGMGRVYLGQSITADVQIKVALKTIRIELINDDLKQKFQNEKNILSKLQHKNIASLIDAGVTENKIPYIATEWVDGQNIKNYCIDKNLSIKQRLKLFLQICEAMTFAHNKLIIHRDLKPDNILVNEQQQIKLLDFGIAKIIDENQYGSTQTQIFTPDYAAPEQLSGQRCTAATDIYSLGIVLFELLTNSKRFNLSDMPMTEIIKIIAAPKAIKLSDIKPIFALPYPFSKIDGALNTIIKKAMHPDPSRRYDSVSSLSLDVENYLGNHPIMAMKDSYWYKFKMLVLRNKISSAIILLALAITSTSFVLTIEQLNEKLLEVEKSQQVTDFLINSIQASDPDLTQGKKITLVEFLQDTKVQIQQKSFTDKKLASMLKQTIGSALTKVGQYKDAEVLLLESIKNNPQNNRARIELAQLFIEQKIFQLAENQILFLLNNSHGLSDNEKSQISILNAKILFTKGEFKEAIHIVKEAIKFQKDIKTPALLIEMKLSLATLLDENGKVKESIHVLREALEVSKAGFGNSSTQTTNILNELARVLSNSSPVPWSEVFSLYDKSLTYQMNIYGKFHPVVAKTLLNQGFAYKFNGNIDKALFNANKAREIAIRNFGESHMLTAHCDLLMSQIHFLEGKLLQAIAELKNTILIYSKFYGEEHFATNELKTTLAVYLLKAKNGQDALVLLLSLYDLQKKQLGEFNKATFYVKLNIIKAYILMGETNKAISNAKKALFHARERIGKENNITIAIQIALVQSYIQANMHNQALPLILEIMSFDFIKSTPVYHETVLKLYNAVQQSNVIKSM